MPMLPPRVAAHHQPRRAIANAADFPALGSSRQRLPPLVAGVGHVEMFIHDSLHTARNTAFEADQVASAMPPGSVMVIDDIRMHEGFAIFARRHPEFQTIVCRHDDRMGMFGIAVKRA